MQTWNFQTNITCALSDVPCACSLRAQSSTLRRSSCALSRRRCLSSPRAVLARSKILASSGSTLCRMRPSMEATAASMGTHRRLRAAC